jgi:protoporphyrinogen oxidase
MFIFFGEKMKKIVIIGAGPAGLTLAYELSKTQKFEIELFESDSEVGGMAKTIKLWNQSVDLGPHRFFSQSKAVNSIWLEALDKEYKMVSRLTRIYYAGKFYDYPLKPINAFLNMGIVKTIICVLSFAAAKLDMRTKKDNFETWVIERFGRKLFSIFFKQYSEKLWGISCSDLDSDFAKQRIKKLSLYEAIKNALFKKAMSGHATLIDEFAYPIKGSGEAYIKMASKARENGVKISLSTAVKSVGQNEKGDINSIQLKNGEFVECDSVVSTMPLTKMVLGLNDVPKQVVEACNKLKFRNTILVYLNIDGIDLFPDQWLYIHSQELQTGRITNFRNWVPELYGKENTSIVALEYWCNDDDKLWSENKEELVRLATDEIKKTGLIKNSEVLDGKVIRVPKCYPVYEVGYKSELEVIQKYLDSTKNLFVIGRYGAFKYNNQDHSILMGKIMADLIKENNPRNLWEINTDYNYQEDTYISETGLNKN